MSVFFIITYDVSDPKRFADYNPGSLPAIGATLAKHGGKLVFGAAPEVLKGEASQSAIGINFPDADAAKAWLDDPEYAEAKAIRLESTMNIKSYLVSGRD